MRLEVLDFEGPTRWRFRLTEAAGAFLADQSVELDAAEWQFEAFTDLRGYLRWNAVPDRRLEHEAELVGAVGEWIAARVLGDIAPVLARQRKAVRLELPPEAAVLGLLPWELARVNGRTLAEQRVSVIVDQLPRLAGVVKGAVGDRLRMLAVFSLPDGTGALNLRRERHELARLVQRIAKVNNRAIELRVLQYGATRQRLEEALLEQPGWDLVHLSGHGLAGGLVLEDDAGRRDLITSTELVDLLDLGSEQIKLVVLSACESAAVTAREHLRLLQLAPGTREGNDADGGSARVLPAAAVAAVAAVAAEIVGRLDCAVLAMRYPVVDDFAIELARSFYDLTLGKGQPVPRALGLSLSQPRVAPPVPTPGAPALSIGTPALFGSRAAGLTLVPPAATGQPLLSVEGQRLAGFPEQPERFVGRVGPMTRAATALAPESGRSGVLFHGMAGAGKTTCAIELAYTHQESFPGGMAWHTAPPLGHDITTALTDFALSLENQLGISLVHLTADTATLQRALPGLTELLEQNRLLIVLDNIESLLTGDGRWRDERWGLLVGAMTGHAGLSRLVLTSRTVVAGLAESVLVEAVHALSLRESVLLARELPNLAALIDAKPPLPAGLTAEQAHGLAARVLAVVQGHPKLIELAEGQATDPDLLAARLAETDQVWLARGTRLEPFLAGADPAPTAAEYLSVLQGWTRATTTTLPPEAMLLLEFLSCLEEDDRVRPVLDACWVGVWRRLGRVGEPSDPDRLLAVLVARALIAQDTDPDGDAVVGWRIHPGVAETTRAATDPVVAAAVDTELGDSWLATLGHALGLGGEQAGELGDMVRRAARSATPYLLRQHRWSHLNLAAGQLLLRDESTATAAALLPMLQAAVPATRDNLDLDLDLGHTHARALIRLQPERGEARLRELLATATTRQHWVAASFLTWDLINHLRVRGRLGEALTLADTLPEYTRRAGHGPLDPARRPAAAAGDPAHAGSPPAGAAAGAGAAGADGRAARPTRPTDPDVIPLYVRENLLQAGVFAARDLRDWQQALDFNAEVHTSKRRRGVSPDEQAKILFTDYAPLLGLGCVEQARDLLIHCRAVFEASNDITMLGQTFGALAHAERELGHLPRAIQLATDALRYTYLAGDPAAIAISHSNLAGYLRRGGHDPRLVWAHHMAAAVICYQTGDGRLTTVSLPNLAGLLGSHPDTAPGSFAEVSTLVEQTDGVHLTRLLDQLPHHVPDPHTAMTEVLHLVGEAATAQADQLIAQWDPVLSALQASLTHPDPATRTTAAHTLDQVLTADAQNTDWQALVPVLRRIHAGETHPATLLPGLDHIETLIIQRALDLLAGALTIDPDVWQALLLPNQHSPDIEWDYDAFVAAVVAAARGDTEARAMIESGLDQLATDPDQTDLVALAATLRQIITGQRNPNLDHLHPDHAELVNTVLTQLATAPPADHPEES